MKLNKKTEATAGSGTVYDHLSPSNRSDSVCCSDLKAGLQVQLRNQDEMRSGDYMMAPDRDWRAEHETMERYYDILSSATIEFDHEK